MSHTLVMRTWHVQQVVQLPAIWNWRCGETIDLSRMLTYSMMYRLKTGGCKFLWNRGAGGGPVQWKKHTEIGYTETPKIRSIVHGPLFQDLSDLSGSTRLNNGNPDVLDLELWMCTYKGRSTASDQSESWQESFTSYKEEEKNPTQLQRRNA